MVDLYKLKIDSEKIEELIPLLEKLDEIIELLSYYDTDEAKSLLELLVKYKNILQYIIDNRDDLGLIAEDFAKGTFNGKRKLDIDLALNKVGIKEAKTIEEALSIWQNQQTTVYYSYADVTYDDNEVIRVNFVNDDSTPINIVTSSELSFQLRANTDFVAKTINTNFIPNASGVIDSLARITDIEGMSNIVSIKLYAVNGDFVKKEPEYTWFDTTSTLMTLFDVMSEFMTAQAKLDEAKKIIEEFENKFNTRFVEVNLTSQLDGRTVFDLGNVITESNLDLLFYGGILIPRGEYTINHTAHTLTTTTAYNNLDDLRRV